MKDESMIALIADLFAIHGKDNAKGQFMIIMDKTYEEHLPQVEEEIKRRHDVYVKLFSGKRGD